MSKKLSYKGKLAMGTGKKIKLSTLNGKTGYKITKLKVIPTNPGTDNEMILQVFTTDQAGSISATVDFSSGNLLGVAYWKEGHSFNHAGLIDVFFDNEIFNQDVFLTLTDGGSGSTNPGNYYIEMETVALSDVQSTQLTLKNLRTVSE
jgi:hypothetical protein